MISFPALLFYTISALLLFCGLMVISRKNPVASAVYLVVGLFLVAALYALMGADFAAAIQVLVYAGAIMVLFVFVIMLLNVDPDAKEKYKLGALDYVALLSTIVAFVAIAIVGLSSSSPDAISGFFNQKNIQIYGGNTNTVGWTFLVLYLWPFEMSSFLILVAIVASIIIAKKPKIENSQNLNLNSKKEF